MGISGWGPRLRKQSTITASACLIVFLIGCPSTVEAITKPFVNASMPELRPTFVVNFDMSTVICQHSEVATDLHVHEISILCDGQKDCYDNPALDDEIFPYCEKKCNSTCNGRGACLYDGKEPQCFCNQGFSGPACEIIDTNECSSKPCHWFAHCQNTVGSFQCKCFDGFEGDGFHCTDIDECEDGIAQCPANSDCINLPGSHFCNCTQGFAPKGSPLERCEDIDECARGIFKCPANELCENTIGDYKCVNECDVGYKASEGRCVDIDECAVNKTSCHQRASCINTDGSYRCACEKGFAGDGHTCEPINLDCRFNNDICSRHAYCLKGLGLCVCKTGYMGDGLICEDVNECQADPSLCKADEKRCLNIVGGFLCCNSTSDDDRCIKDEAAYCPGGCGTNAACRDEKCQCFPGYHGDPNHECQDVNECEMDDTCKGVGEWCQNLLGTYICCNPKSDSRFCQKPDPAAILFSVDQETVSLDRSAAAGGGFSHYESGGNKASSSGGLIVEDYGSEIVPLNCTSYCPGNSECLQGVCQCKNGYEGDPNQGCQDIDECERKMDNCNESITGHWCVNDEGSYHCCTSINEVDCVGLVLTRSGFEQEAKGGASAAAASSSGFHSNATIEGGVAAGELQQSGQKGAGGQGFIEKGGKKESSSGGLVSVIEGDDDHGEVPDDLLKPKEGETGLVITADGFQTNGTSTEELETLMTTLSGMMTTPLETSTLKGSTVSQRGFTGVPVSEIDLTKTTQISQSVTKASSPKIEVSTWSSKQTEHFESSTSTSGKGTFVVHEKGSSSNHSSGGNIKLIDGNAGEFTIKINELTTTPSLEEKTSKPGENGLEISSRKTEPPKITVDGEGTQSEEINDEKHRRKSTTVPPVTEDFDMLKPAPNETGLEITAHGFSEIEPEVPTTSQPDLVLTASPTKNTPLPSPSTQEPTTTTPEVSKTIATISTAATTRKPSGPEIAIDSGEEGDVAGKDGKVTKPGKIIVSIGPSHESTTIKIQSTTASMTSTPSTLSTKSTSQATSAETTTKLTTEVTTSEIPTASATSQQTTKKSSTTVKENVEKTTKQAETSVESTTGVTTVSVDTTKQESTTKTTIAPNPTVSSSEKPAEITKTTSETKTTKVPLKETTSIHVTSKTSLPSSKSVTISPSTSTKTTTKAGIEITQVTKDIGLEITKFTEVTTPSSSSSSSSPTSPTEKTSISTASTKQSVQPVHKVTSSATEKPLVATLTSTSSQITNPTTTTKVDETTTQNVRGPFGRSESPDVSESTQAPLIVTTQQETKRPLTDATQTTTLKPVPAEATIIPKFVCISSDSCGIDAYCERRSGGCRCHPGFQGNPPEERCIDVNECLEGTHNCHETARCHNFVGSYKCFCPQGFRQQSDGSCQDINECNESAGGCCSGNATCHNSPGTYECRCNEGYVGDGYTCIPSQKRACTEEESRSFACGLNNLCMIDDYGKKDCNECKPGFEMKESICVDVDECADANLNMCSKFAICVNTVGTYMCKCKNGFKGDGYMCEDIDECSAGRKPCHGSAECANTEGSYTCTCYEGWIGDGKTACINPMNRECEDLVKTCGTAEHMTCLSARVSNGTVQSVCECEANYRWNSVSKKCEDIDECLEDRHDCDPSNSHCKNIPGGYECECMDGYEGRGGICVDIDECKMGTSGCHHMAMCINRAGSCGCQCMNGYTGDGTSCLVMPPNVTTTMETTTTTKAQTTPTTPTTTTTTLTTPKPNLTTKPSQRATTMQEEESNETERPCPENWIRNCSLYNKKCEVDLEENPQCSSCISGYQPSVNETCIPINGKGGCTPTTCDPHADCQEIPPNQHRCFCRIGYIGDGRKCDDVDECSVPGVCATEAHCVNKDGSFDCLCPAGFTGNGFFCTFIVDREDNVTLPRPNCLIDTGLCHPYAKCSMNGSCVCFDGFEGDGIKVCKSLHLSTKTSPKPTPFTTKESKNISSTGFVTKLTIELGPSTTKAPTQPREKLPVIKTVEQSTKAPLTATLETTAPTMSIENTTSSVVTIVTKINPNIFNQTRTTRTFSIETTQSQTTHKATTPLQERTKMITVSNAATQTQSTTPTTVNTIELTTTEKATTTSVTKPIETSTSSIFAEIDSTTSKSSTFTTNKPITLSSTKFIDFTVFSSTKEIQTLSTEPTVQSTTPTTVKLTASTVEIEKSTETSTAPTTTTKETVTETTTPVKPTTSTTVQQETTKTTTKESPTTKLSTTTKETLATVTQKTTTLKPIETQATTVTTTESTTAPTTTTFTTTEATTGTTKAETPTTTESTTAPTTTTFTTTEATTGTTEAEMPTTTESTTTPTTTTETTPVPTSPSTTTATITTQTTTTVTTASTTPTTKIPITTQTTTIPTSSLATTTTTSNKKTVTTPTTAATTTTPTTTSTSPTTHPKFITTTELLRSTTKSNRATNNQAETTTTRTTSHPPVKIITGVPEKYHTSPKFSILPHLITGSAPTAFTTKTSSPSTSTYKFNAQTTSPNDGVSVNPDSKASTRHHFGTVLPGCETWPPRNTQSPTTTPTRLPIARATTPLPSVGAISGAKRCTPDDRSACHALALCEPDGVCRCKNGYEGDGYQTCTRVPSIDCVDDPNVCDTRGECNKARRRCECTMGYIGDGIICAPDPQDCVLRHNLCSAEAMCVGRRCQCQPGYTGDGVVCVSIHERETNASACVQNSHFDGAVCKCNVGYLGNGLCCVADPRDCTHFPGICHSNAFCQKEERSCKCNHGYQGNGFSCLPLRSCRSTPTLCHRDALCLPTGDCLCKEGYFGDGLSCKRRGFIGHRENELSDTPSACGNLCNVETELCINAKCECKHGFEKIAGKCTDVNECLVDQPCHQLASCKNLDGSYECTCPDGYHGDGKSCVENVKLGELQVLCEPGQMTLLLENSTELNDGRIFVRGQSENPHCTKQFSAFHRESKPYRFVVPFEHCNVRMEEKDTVAVTVVVQKHPMFITALSDAYDLRCTYPIGVREVESHVNVSDVTPSMTLSDESVGPLCSLVVTNEQQEMVNSAMVGQSLHLTLSVEPSASYAILPKNCFAINIETGERYSLTDRWGCAIDAELFPEWTRVRPSKTQALFRTFKWPDSSMIRFQCDCSACVGDCPPVDCERRRQIAQRLFRFRRARHTGNQEASETEDLMMTNEAFVEHDEEEKLGHSLVNSPRIAFSRLIAVHERREHSNDRSSPKAEESRSEVLKESSDDERVCVRTAILAASTLLFILCLSILIFMGLRHRRKTLQEYPSLPSLS